MDYFESQEGNIKFIVDPRGEYIDISAENIDTGVKREFVYKCEYPCLFGYDCMDIENINRKLDELIELVK